ncbi:hypothetical protein L208DRAFT_1211437, partial [Tricholoma matsutake]
LPTALRPKEVQWWIKCKKLIGVLPHIEKLSEFGAVWMQWWANMQLSWREGDSLAKILPMDVDWDPIHRGGSNGLSLIVMALLWWIKLTNTGNGPNKVLSGAISDLMWVLSELVS